jgi:hypothetical protein
MFCILSITQWLCVSSIFLQRNRTAFV